MNSRDVEYWYYWANLVQYRKVDSAKTAELEHENLSINVLGAKGKRYINRSITGLSLSSGGFGIPDAENLLTKNTSRDILISK